MIDCNIDVNEHVIYIDKLDSTNSYLSNLCENEDVKEYTTIISDFQTNGRGQIGNRWESQRGENLTFSTVVYPTSILAREQFIISIITSTAICEALSEYTDDITIKWPNDIYWKDKKICGILIENDLQGINIYKSILGIGINVNQEQFCSDAPNPVSLYQIINTKTDRNLLLNDIICRLIVGFDMIKKGDSNYLDKIYSKYKSMLYRKVGNYLFNDKDGDFIASIDNVELNGHLLLKDLDGKKRSYLFKEVKFIIP